MACPICCTTTQLEIVRIERVEGAHKDGEFECPECGAEYRVLGGEMTVSYNPLDPSAVARRAGR